MINHDFHLHSAYKIFYHTSKRKYEDVQNRLIGKGWKIVEVIEYKHNVVKIVVKRRFTL